MNLSTTEFSASSQGKYVENSLTVQERDDCTVKKGRKEIQQVLGDIQDFGMEEPTLGG